MEVTQFPGTTVTKQMEQASVHVNKYSSMALAFNPKLELVSMFGFK